MFVDIDQQIKVAAVFDEGVVTPKWFYHCGDKHEVTRVHYKWKEKKGEQLIVKLSLSSSNSFYEVSFDPETLIWKLCHANEDCF